MLIRLRRKKVITTTIVVTFILQSLWPAGYVFALTGGPSQPDFAAFEPISTSNLVDPLTGQLTYNLPVLNIPGPSGGGYALSLSYHSGITPEQEASWVGLGWSLTPGSITRQKRGFPDDYNGLTIRNWNRTKPSITTSVTASTPLETFSTTLEDIGSASASIRYNNHTGYDIVAGVSASIKGLATLNVGSDGVTASTSIGIGDILGFIDRKTWTPEDSLSKYEASTWLKNVRAGFNRFASPGLEHLSSSGKSNARHHPYRGESTNIKISAHAPLPILPAGFKGELSGNFSRQENLSFVDSKSYGYMYSGNATSDGNMDYVVEKDYGFDRRDHYLGVPLSNADYFNVSAEGLGGAFRLYNDVPGQFSPPDVKSTVTIQNSDYQIKLGQDVGIGASSKAGVSEYFVGPWKDNRTVGGKSWEFAAPGSRDEPFHFRMMNDMGGAFLPWQDDAPTKFDITQTPAGTQVSTPQRDLDYTVMNRPASERSTYIAYSTIGEMKRARYAGISPPGRLGLQDPDFNALEYLDLLPDDAIGEFSLTNASGTRYNFGLPVVSRNEGQLQYGLKGLNYSIEEDGTVQVYAPDLDNAPVLVGQQDDNAYASEYLLTSIVTSDYVDRTGDGLTMDDFGGWVKFSYAAAGRESGTYSNPGGIEFFSWRIPYKGLNYVQNSLETRDDDIGSVAYGEKAKFHLASIETKSHLATFHTNGLAAYPSKSPITAYGSTFSRGWKWLVGSSDIRKDGYPAIDDMRAAANGNRDASNNAVSAASEDPTDPNAAQKDNLSRKLERIELWSKNEDGNPVRLIQSVRFEFDGSYSLCKNLPNSYNDAGKLTLTRVVFEHWGVKNARISPYVFGYEYKTSTDYEGLSSGLRSKYDDILEANDNYSAADQNPDYSTAISDRWGYYRKADDALTDNYISWVDQNPDASFDPAAWHLKWIRLPSGGEIHVQYEQADYAFVQDQPAMVMAAIDSYAGYNGTVANPNKDPKRFYLNLESTFGSAYSTASGRNGPGDDLLDVIEDVFVDGKERVFFKLFHSLDGDVASDKTIAALPANDERHEYISGYARVSSVGFDDGTGPDDAGLNLYYIQISSEDEDEPGIGTPREAALDYIHGMKGKAAGSRPLDVSGSSEGSVRALLSLSHWLFNVVGITDDVGDDRDEIDPAKSWVRIPISSKNKVARAKLGGGVRVKTVLTYDPGALGVDPASNPEEGHVFGTIYEYVRADGATSGVATNEPNDGREESALVKPLDKRKGKGFFDRLMTGKELQAFEGPIGESLLPGPNINYERVVQRNIHTGKTNAGFTISEYYTTKDYPSVVIYNPEQAGPENVTAPRIRSSVPFILWSPLGSWFDTRREAFQGYSFVLNTMNGKPKRVTTYGGVVADKSTWVESSMKEYEYYLPGEPIPVLTSDHGPTEIEYRHLGKEMEVVSEGRESVDWTYDFSVAIDGSVGIVFPPPFFATGAPHIGLSRHSVRTHVTSKVIRYPSPIKSVLARQDGIESRTENLAYSAQSGQPVAQRTEDGYIGLTLGSNPGPHDRGFNSVTWLAAESYPEMGKKSFNEGRIVSSSDDLKISKLFRNGLHYFSFEFLAAAVTCDPGDWFTPGDLVEMRIPITPKDGAGDPVPSQKFTWSLGVYHVDRVVGSHVIVQPHSLASFRRYFWIGGVPNEVVEHDIEIEVLRSGRTNQLDIPSGSMTRYAETPTVSQ